MLHIKQGATQQNNYDEFGNYLTVRKGKAYVFTRSGTTWSEEAILLPDTVDVPDEFLMGHSVALSGDTAVVGHKRDLYADVGEPHVFIRSGGTWSLQGKITLVHDPSFGSTSEYISYYLIKCFLHPCKLLILLCCNSKI